MSKRDNFLEQFTDREDAGETVPYTTMDVTVSKTKWKTEITKIVEQFRAFYINSDLLPDNPLVAMVEKLESNSLFLLYKKLMYTEHMIDSAMEQLDSQGVNMHAYKVLIDMQMSSMHILNEFTRYLHNTPQVFKSLMQEMQSYDRIQQNQPHAKGSFPDEYDDEPTRDQVGLLDEIDDIIKQVQSRNSAIDVNSSKPFPKEYEALGEKPHLNDFEVQADAAEEKRKARDTDERLKQKVRDLTNGNKKDAASGDDCQA